MAEVVEGDAFHDELDRIARVLGDLIDERVATSIATVTLPLFVAGFTLSLLFGFLGFAARTGGKRSRNCGE